MRTRPLHSKARLGWVLLVGAGLGCSSPPAVTVLRASAGEPHEPVRGDPLKLRRSNRDPYSGVRGGFFVIRSQDDWHAAWLGRVEPTMPSSLDTSRSMLLLAASERSDTVRVELLRALETSNAVHVFVRETERGAGCVEKVERPIDAAQTFRVDKPVRFYVETVQGEACGDPPAVEVKCRVAGESSWRPSVSAQPGDTVECTMAATSRGKFAIVDRVLRLDELPGGSTAKLAYAEGPTRGSLPIDVFGAFTVRGEASDDGGRRSTAVAKIEAQPPKSIDPLVHVVWSNFDVSDDPDTFPRVVLEATDGAAEPRTCSAESPEAELCSVRTRSAFSYMTLKAREGRAPIALRYLDERIEAGPLACVQVYFDGKRTAEKCDRVHRSPDARWEAGVVDMATGALLDPEPPPPPRPPAPKPKAASKPGAKPKK